MRKSRARITAYLLPRVVLVMIARAMLCVASRKVYPEVDRPLFGFVGACWAFCRTAYFGYLWKLRRDIEILERNRRYGVVHSSAKFPLTPAE